MYDATVKAADSDRVFKVPVHHEYMINPEHARTLDKGEDLEPDMFIFNWKYYLEYGKLPNTEADGQPQSGKKNAVDTPWLFGRVARRSDNDDVPCSFDLMVQALDPDFDQGCFLEEDSDTVVTPAEHTDPFKDSRESLLEAKRGTPTLKDKVDLGFCLDFGFFFLLSVGPVSLRLFWICFYMVFEEARARYAKGAQLGEAIFAATGRLRRGISNRARAIRQTYHAET